MAQRRPITGHPAFAPLLALWFAALLGLGVAVLPSVLLERVLNGLGAGALVPLTTAGRMMASGAAALLGAALGLALALALPLYRRGRRDPRPIYAEPELPPEHSPEEEPVRRLLRVREELAEHRAEPAGNGDDGAIEPSLASQTRAQAEEGFMILTPQPVHPPRPAPDIETLLEQFDSALAGFRSGDGAQSAPSAGVPDPVHAFVARQTGTPAPSPLGGTMPDHQAELRAALDKLARAQRKE